MPFVEAENQVAFLKAGILGLQGSGKTTLAANMAIGLHKLLKDKELIENNKVYFIDTESGSSFLVDQFREAGISLMVDNTRAFTDLCAAAKLVQKEKGILIVDSITHFWTEIQRAYKTKHKRDRITFDDWGNIKREWERFTNLYVNGTFHCILCGRMGWNYDFFEDEAGKKQLAKTSVKMKAEGEFGYEPNLLISMEQHQTLDSGGNAEETWRTATVLKDKSRRLDGKSFRNATFREFQPHVEALALGGKHVCFDESRSSVDEIEVKSGGDWQKRGLVVEEAQELIKKHYPSQSAEDKKRRIEILETCFSVRSWGAVKRMDHSTLMQCWAKLLKELGESELAIATPEIEKQDENEVPF